MYKKLFLLTIMIFWAMGIGLPFSLAADVSRTTQEELIALLDNPDLILIDVRLERDWKKSDSKIKGAVYEPPKAVETWAIKYPKDRRVVLY